MYASLVEFIGSFAAKTHLARLLARVERGESFTITRRGRAVAKLAPVADEGVQRRSPGDVVAQFRHLRERIALGLEAAARQGGGDDDRLAGGAMRPTLRELIDDGRKH